MLSNLCNRVLRVHSISFDFIRVGSFRYMTAFVRNERAKMDESMREALEEEKPDSDGALQVSERPTRPAPPTRPTRPTRPARPAQIYVMMLKEMKHVGRCTAVGWRSVTGVAGMP